MFVFLQSWRATLIPTLTMPVSLIGAFAFVNLLDFSINTLTLFAIVLATGIVVDDAIVVIENIERHIQEYKKPPLTGGVRRDARGVRRRHRHGARADRRLRAGGVLPRDDRPLVSAVRADDRVLRGDLGVQRPDADAGPLGAAAASTESLGKGRFFGAIERVIHGGTNLYVRTVRGLVRVRWAMVVVFVGLLGLTYFVYNRVPQAFVPEEDAGYFITDRPGTRRARRSSTRATSPCRPRRS